MDAPVAATNMNDDDPVLARLAARHDAPARTSERFLEWAAQSDPALDGPVSLSRYLAELRAGRPDLLDAYPQIPGAHVADYREWARVFGREQVPIAEAFVPAALADTAPGYNQAGINLAGFLTAELGVGEVARRVALALRAGHLPFSTTTFDRTANRAGVSFAADERARFDTNVICINADSWGAFAQHVGPSFFRGRHCVAVWFWETSVFPSMFHSAFAGVDELWAASDYVADVLRAAAPDGIEVRTFPLPIVAPEVSHTNMRERLGIGANRPMFVTSFDHNSVVERKNPLGAMRAFCDAFDHRASSSSSSSPVLVVKSINGHLHPDADARIRAAAHGRDDIVVHDGYFDAADNIALLAQADAIVSLHRAEGFGFNLADAMALGVPVIATGYSGNLAFMQEEDCWLVPATEITVGDGHFPYPPEGVWAEPDHDAAVAALRAVAAQPDGARAKAERARTRVLADFTPERCGTFIRNAAATARAERERIADAERAAAAAVATAQAAADRPTQRVLRAAKRIARGALR